VGRLCRVIGNAAARPSVRGTRRMRCGGLIVRRHAGDWVRALEYVKSHRVRCFRFVYCRKAILELHWQQEVDMKSFVAV
jgi:hypothetical protein